MSERYVWMPGGMALRSSVATVNGYVPDLFVSETDFTTLESAARRVLDAFTAYGNSNGVVDNARAHQECEAAMTALAVAVDEDRYTLTDAGRAALGKGK